MKKALWIIVVLMAIGFTACAAPAEPSKSTLTQCIETEAPTAPPPVDIGGTMVETDVSYLDLTADTYDLDILVSVASQLGCVSEIKLDVACLTPAQLETIQMAFPKSEITYSLELLGETVTQDTDYLDFSTVTVEQAQSVLEQLPFLTGLEQINFVSEDGNCIFCVEHIPILDKFRETLPKVKLRVSFQLFGQRVTSEDTRIEYYRTYIGNEGVDTLKMVLPYLSSCEYLLVDGCGVDNEVMAELRDAFPQTEIVWRVWLVRPNYDLEGLIKQYSFLTDTHLIRTMDITDNNCDVLKYCTKTKYVDFGHNRTITDCSFLAYMPELEVAILAITDMWDLSPLAHCPQLEYLEIFSAEFSDLSPLTNCKNLQHLNFSSVPKITDITPLYNLSNLKRVRAVNCPNIPVEQWEEFAKRVPDCEIQNQGREETGLGWRYDEERNRHPRYILLQEQMEYENIVVFK